MRSVHAPSVARFTPPAHTGVITHGVVSDSRRAQRRWRLTAQLAGRQPVILEPAAQAGQQPYVTGSAGWLSAPLQQLCPEAGGVVRGQGPTHPHPTWISRHGPPP